MEGVWPDCYAVNTWVRGLDEDGRDAEDVLGGFERWPTWMWACEDEVVALLTRVCEGGAAAGPSAEHRFAVEQNAAVARNAERYYRAMVRGGPESWNVRDTHMVDTLDRLMDHHGPNAKGVVGAHNTHVGDARATDMAADGRVNVGQLVRERHGRDDAVVVGFGGYRGSVVAGSAWGAPMARMPVPEARRGSVEDLLHDEIGEDALLVFPNGRSARGWLDEPRPRRAIGVVYHPERERYGNYVPTVLAERYDVFCFSTTPRRCTLRARGARPDRGARDLPPRV